jgi:hypothetical protein
MNDEGNLIVECLFTNRLNRMKRRHLLRLIPALFATSFASAQTESEPFVDKELLNFLKIVEDADGYTNLRAGAGLDTKITGKVLSGGPVFVNPEPENGFHTVYLDNEDGHADRYIHGSRLKPVTGWKAFGPEGSTGILNHGSFEAVVTDPAFVASEHRVTRNADGMVLVNGKAPWGQDGGEPKRILKLEVSIDGKSVALPAAATDNLYEPNFETLVLLTPGDPSDRAFLMMANSDGAGGYYVVWAFEKGAYRGRTVMMP